MQTSFRDFFAHLISDSTLQSRLSQQNGLVTGLSVQKSGLVLIQMLVSSPWPVDLLVSLEMAIESTLPAREVMIRQMFSEPLDGRQQQKAVVDLKPWLLRHLRQKDAFLAALLSNAAFVPDDLAASSILVQVTDASRQELSHKVSGELSRLAELGLSFTVDFVFVASDSSLRDYTHNMVNLQQDQARQARAATQLQHPGGEFCSVPSASGAPRPGSGSGSGSGSGPISGSGTPAGPGASAKDQQQQASSGPAAAAPYRRQPKVDGLLWGKVNPELKRQAIRDLNNESGLVLLEGEIFSLECRSVSNGTRLLYKFALTDLSSSVSCIMFAKPAEQETIDDVLKQSYLRISAEISFDAQFSKDLQARVVGIQAAKRPAGRSDQAEQRRVELHAHTKMSTKDAVCETKDLVKLAARFGHPAVAITDHGVVQSFPDAASARKDLARKGQDIKIIYGLEGYLVDDGPTVAWVTERADLSEGFVALDVETTGLDPSHDRMIEIAAVPFTPDGAGGFVAGEPWVTLINPNVDIPPKITELTGITALDLQGAPDAWTALSELAERIGNKTVVAHNAFFDLSFLRYEGFRTAQEADPRLKFNPPLVDTLAMARALVPHLDNFKLNTVAAHLGITLDRHHRADDDARACGQIFARLLQRAGVDNLEDLNAKVGHLSDDAVLEHKRSVYHIILLAQDTLGLYNLYRLVSESHIRYFHSRPRIPRTLLQYFRAGLIIGSACEAGEIFQAVMQAYRNSNNQYDQARSLIHQQDMVSKARFYDYLEIQPTSQQWLLSARSGQRPDQTRKTCAI